uniref:Uncharacterized protein n=1 Tax=Mycena chlorophos TaxID=658473 RepID=A0ABQ0M592_MYCCL|nr:predicted protein [Mycena chlorophos]
MTFSFAQNMTKLDVVTNAFAFAGLFLDVLGSASALIGQIQLQSGDVLLQQQASSIQTLREIISDKLHRLPPGDQDTTKLLTLLNHLYLLDKIRLAPIYYPKLWLELGPSFEASASLMEQLIKETFISESDKLLQIRAAYALADYTQTKDRLMSRKNRTVLGIITSRVTAIIIVAGLHCFIAGAVCLMISSQPVAVWASSVALLGFTAAVVVLMYGGNLKLSQ